MRVFVIIAMRGTALQSAVLALEKDEYLIAAQNRLADRPAKELVMTGALLSHMDKMRRE